MRDKITELHALHVLDVLEAAQETVDLWNWGSDTVDIYRAINRIEDALTRLDRLEVVTEVAA